MKTFLVKQKFRLGGERFDIKDDRGVVNYQVEGSFFQNIMILLLNLPLMVLLKTVRCILFNN